MSLINDALKRARQAQQKNESTGGPPLMPVEPESPGLIAWLLPGAVIFLIVAAIFVIGLAMARHTVTTIVSAPNPDPPTQELAVATAPVVPPAPPSPSPSSLLPPPVTNVEVAAPPLPRLQGIVLDTQRPWAIVDGQTVFTGDRVNGFHVKEISKFTVTLTDAGGKLQTIHLGN